MTLEKLIENRIKLIEQDTSSYLIQSEQQKLGITFMYYISIFFLIFGIILALLSSMQISIFSEKWMNSGLFYLCTLIFLLKIYGYGKYITLKKHKVYLKQVLNQKTDFQSSLPDSVNAEFENELKAKNMTMMNVLLVSLSIIGGVCYLWKFKIWMHFDLVIFLIWSIYGLLCYHKIKRMQQITSIFSNRLKHSAIKY
ncbi:hypothetical protein ACXR6G_15740 [Ancylomarina sp. YFZ004]